MNKFVLRFSALLLIIGLLVGCGSDEGSETDATTNGQTEQNTSSEVNEEAEETITVTISKDKEAEIITEKKIPIEEGAILFDVMEENFEIETDYDGKFISSIDGVAPKEGEQKSWMFFINGEMAMKGVKEIELSPGDKVSFDLQAWE